MSPLLSTNPTREARNIYFAKWFMVIGYIALTFAGAWWFGGYLEKVGGTGNVPDIVYLVFGPVIALAHVHGLLIYLLTTAIVLPLLVATVGSKGWKRFIFPGSALIVWVAIGHWMYAG